MHVDRSERICIFDNSGSVEDEYHIVLSCS